MRHCQCELIHYRLILAVHWQCYAPSQSSTAAALLKYRRKSKYRAIAIIHLKHSHSAGLVAPSRCIGGATGQCSGAAGPPLQTYGLLDALPRLGRATAPYPCSCSCHCHSKLSHTAELASVIKESLSLPTATATDFHAPCVCARPSYPPKLPVVPNRCPRAWPLILQSNLIVFWNSLQG